ncbi:DUF6931 family protein [Falsiroseomonas sp. HW251]|uniref:DUF6931 family protein n=1 Tax=Falsiroseomonas sp. HW251 TaxID=3390998 RepID=UPI003D321BA7
MSQSLPPRLKFAGALPDVIARADLPPEAAPLVEGVAGPAEAMDCLAAAGFLSEAVKIAAHALPKREAVWWACMCARHTAPKDVPSLEAICQAAEAWVRSQTEDARYAAFRLAEANGLDTPEAWAAVGAFWSGDSMSAPEAPKVPPAPHLAGLAVAGSVNLSSIRGDVLLRDARVARFLDSARDIARGGAGRLPPEG